MDQHWDLQREALSAPSSAPFPSAFSSLTGSGAGSRQPNLQSHRYLMQVPAALSLHRHPLCIHEIFPFSAVPGSPFQFIQVSRKMAQIQCDQMLS